MRHAAIGIVVLLLIASALAPVSSQTVDAHEATPDLLQDLRAAVPIPVPTKAVDLPVSTAAPAIIARDAASGRTTIAGPYAPAGWLTPATAMARQRRSSMASEATGGVLGDPAPIFDTSQFPFRTVHKLLLRYRVGGLDYFFVCSATAVSEFHLLTTGNCIYNHDPNGDGFTSDQRFADEVWAWAGQTDRIDPLQVEDFPFGLAKGTFFRVPNGWINNQDLNDDWALITLSRRVGAHTGWMGRETDVQTSTLESTGYPVEVPFVPAGNLLQYHSSEANNVSAYFPGRIGFDALIYGGHSGGPVWRENGGNHFLQGIISTTDRSGNAEATRLRASMLNDINGFITDDEFARPPIPHPDLIEYLLETGQKDLLTGIAAPGQLFDVEYNVFNVGHAPTGTITVDFYLSDNNFISTFDTHVERIQAGNLDPFFFFRDTVSLTVPPHLPAGTYWVGWIMQAAAAEPSSFDNTAVIDSKTLLVSPADANPDIRVEPKALDFRESNQLAGEKIFVEIDWMQDGTHSHRPSQAVIDTIIATFAAAGHEIRIDVSNAIPHENVIEIINSPGSSPHVQTLMNQHFDNAGDSRYYYSLWGHNYSFNGQFTGSSGIADLPGRVHLVTLGNFPNQTGTPEHQVGTMIHEFGHNLGQKHGGVDHGNFKPNYLSVMNYHYQLEGIGPALMALGLTSDGSGFDDFSYSHGQQIDLDENNLDESVGIGLGNPADWNCNGNIDASVSADLQAADWCQINDGRSQLTDFDNWSDLRPFIRSASTTRQSVQWSEPCISWEAHRPLHERVEALRKADRLPSSPVRRRLAEKTTRSTENSRGPATSVQRSFTIYNDGATQLNIDEISLSGAASWISWAPSSPFTIAPGGTRQVTVTVDKASAPAGELRRKLTIRSNDPDEDPFPGGIDLLITDNPDVVFEDGFEP